MNPYKFLKHIKSSCFILKLKSIRLKLGDSLDHSEVGYMKAFFWEICGVSR